MKAISGREFSRIIARHGWMLLRVNGSHHIYGKPEAWCDYQFRSTVIG
jgi:predicted RNA binding protein YcfA (HicA-like mRNA interferase family)